MLYHRKKACRALILGTLFLLIQGCASKETPTAKGGFYYRSIYFGTHLKPLYKAGIKDGCETARGDYHKSHQLFKWDDYYRDGWFLGRNKCRSLLKLDNGDNLIL